MTYYPGWGRFKGLFGCEVSGSLVFPVQGTGPTRRCLFDWLSVSMKTQSDEEMNEALAAARAAVRDAFGYGDTKPLKRPGNFGEGEEFVRVGGSLRYTKRTLAALNDWDDEGRCVGWANLTLRGSTGVGALRADAFISLLMCLDSIGFQVIRRIDLTIDLFDHDELTVDFIRGRLRSGAWKIPRRDPSTYLFHGPVCARPQGQDEGTIYLGPASSNNRVVIYNKGAQKGSDRPWVRFELRSTREHAAGLRDELLALGDAIFESGAPERRAADFITSAVRGSADIYDVTAFPDLRKLPKNWTRSPMAHLPSEMEPVFAATAPLDIGDLRVRGGYASAVRHMSRNGSRTMWKMCLAMIATDQDPGKGLLLLGLPSAHRLTQEDFEEIARDTNLAPGLLEQAELTALSMAAQYDGFDINFISSDKTELRRAVAATLGGVQ